MRLSGDAYSKRLESFSNFTLVLISGVHGMSKEINSKSLDITTNSELTEEQVIERLLELIRTKPQPSTPISFEEALEIVCDAYEEGYIYSLYEILDNDSTIVFVDEDKYISNSREIVEFLVKERCNHLYCSDEKTITCDILKVAEGVRYGIGEKCILLTYHLENGAKENLIIKVHFADGSINKLEMFYPFGPLRLVAEE